MNEQHQSQSVWAEVEPYCVLRRLWKNLWMILMCAALFALAAYVIATTLTKPKYTCSATFVVTPRNSSSIYQSGASAVTASTAEQFSSLLSGTTLVNRVKRLGGADVAGATVSATAVKETNLIQLNTTGPSPRSAYYMCMGILDHYEDYSQFVFDSVMLESVSAPTVPTKSALHSRQLKAMIIAAPLGALAMIALLAVLCITSGTIQTVHGARNQVDGTLLVTLNHQRKRRTLKSLFRRKKTALLISNPTTSFQYMESIHQLRARLEHAKHRYGCKTFLLTSVSENEGKSTVAANLALSLAKRHKKVLLVDCDLRKSAQHLIFDETEKHVTLNALLRDNLDPEQLVKALHYRKAENLFILYAANVQRHSAELLGSSKMSQLLQVLRKGFDYVILDSSPMGFFTDSEVICDIADASVLVVRQDLLPDRTVNDAIDSLSRCKAKFLGFVFNDLRTLNIAAGIVGGKHYGYGYNRKYGYGYGYHKGYGYGGYGGYGVMESAKQSDEESTEEIKLSTSRKKED